MKKLTKKCPECGRTFEYIDIRNEPETCGRRMCVVNHKYRMAHMDPLTGKIPTPKEVRKL